MKISYDWFSPAIPVLEKVLGDWRGNKLNFLEIGCYEGLSTVWFLREILTNEASRIACIDTFEGGLDHKKLGLDFSRTKETFLENTQAWSQKIDLYHGRSTDFFVENLGLKNLYDCVYIDGSHVAVDVLTDAVLSWRLLKKEGLIIFDDYKWGDDWLPALTPRLAIDAFLDCYEPFIKTIHKDYHVAIKKLNDYE